MTSATATPTGDSDIAVTAELAQWISTLKRSDIPDAAWAHAKLCLLDALGCALFGSQQPWGRIAAETALDLSPGGRASLVGHNAFCGVDAAAMANGTATHGFELDDLHLRAHRRQRLGLPRDAVAECIGRGRSEDVLLVQDLARRLLGGRRRGRHRRIGPHRCGNRGADRGTLCCGC